MLFCKKGARIIEDTPFLTASSDIFGYLRLSQGFTSSKSKYRKGVQIPEVPATMCQIGSKGWISHSPRCNPPTIAIDKDNKGITCKIGKRY